MSGHSKWSTIKRQKESLDKKRGQEFTRLSRNITLAVREGSGIEDPDSNFKLRIAIEKAKQANMPKENIQRAIDRGTGKGSEGQVYEDIVYEGYGPDGVAVIIETSTDNKKRTAAEVKFLLDRSGGSLGSPNSVMFQFEQRGVIRTPKSSMSEEDIMNAAIEAGADDVEVTDDMYEIITKRDSLREVRDVLEMNANIPYEAYLEYHPTVRVPLTSEKAEKIVNLTSQLEELDDVQAVYTNVDIQD